MPLAPGQTMDGLMFLESPYPKDRNVTVTNQTAQVVAKEDGVLRAVPLNEVKNHEAVWHCSIVQLMMLTSKDLSCRSMCTIMSLTIGSCLERALSCAAPTRGSPCLHRSP